jgi:hypothetical protein
VCVGVFGKLCLAFYESLPGETFRLAAGEDATMKETTGRAESGKCANSAAADKKKRLAAALRRNLTKRKDIKEAKIVDNPDRD